MFKITKHVILEIIRNRFLIGYTLLLLLITVSLFLLDNDPAKGMISLLNIMLIVLPLVSIVFPTVQLYNSSEFTELLLAQPLSRKNIFFSQYAGMSLAFTFSFLIGCGIPLSILNPGKTSLIFILTGIFLSLSFVSLAFLGATLTRDKSKGIGIALLLWFYFALIYDALLLFFLYSFSDYPIEKTTLLLSSLNPVDIARVIMLLEIDNSALMGYSGAFYQKFLGKSSGTLYLFGCLLLWLSIPVLIGMARFRKKDI
jgi:Cu-processing system permease protein